MRTPLLLAALAPAFSAQELDVNVPSLNVNTGGTQILTLDAGAAFANQFYVVLGSLTGTSPGLPIGPVIAPIIADEYTVFLLTHPLGPPLFQVAGQFDAQGVATSEFTLGASTLGLASLAGLTLWHAYVVTDGVFNPLGVSGAETLEFVACGTSGPSFVSTVANGSAATTPHYATGFAATVNDPVPRLIGPGHQFTAGVSSQILLAPLSDPMNASHAHTWSGGDEVGWFRDRMTVDGTTPGIDRIFFVARNTTETPNHVDWDGASFSNETSLPPAQGSIQRLCVTPDGDLIGNDFFGIFYLWDKQADYAIDTLFQISNTPGSVPWGASLDTNLGKIGFDPTSGLVLLPVNNDAVSSTGQLYGFDLDGNRVFVDQDLMETTPTGFNSYRYGVTVDAQDPVCRVLVHGGRDSGNMFVARFTGGVLQKDVAQIGGADDQGGWLGALVGGEFWTNTNSFSYGVVQRALPLDW